MSSRASRRHVRYRQDLPNEIVSRIELIVGHSQTSAECEVGKRTCESHTRH
jgi:hypothetical protein